MEGDRRGQVYESQVAAYVVHLTPMDGVKGKFQAGDYMIGQGLGLE